jgi:hypothetical protein
MHEQFPNSGKTSAPQAAAERLDRTGGAHSDPIDSDRDNDHVRELATSSDAALEAARCARADAETRRRDRPDRRDCCDGRLARTVV